MPCPRENNQKSKKPGSIPLVSDKNLGETEMCEFAANLVMRSLDGYNPSLIEKARQELDGCKNCLNVLELQLRVRGLMSMHLKVKAPAQLRINITEGLKRMDLGQLDITDFI